MVLQIELRNDQERAAREAAKQRGVTIEEFVREVVVSYITRLDDKSFQKLADEAVRKHGELLKRLA